MTSVTTREDIQQRLRANFETLRQNYYAVRIGLFGSYALNEATPQSDVDVLVDFAEPVG